MKGVDTTEKGVLKEKGALFAEKSTFTADGTQRKATAITVTCSNVLKNVFVFTTFFLAGSHTRPLMIPGPALVLAVHRK